MIPAANPVTSPKLLGGHHLPFQGGNGLIILENNHPVPPASDQGVAGSLRKGGGNIVVARTGGENRKGPVKPQGHFVRADHFPIFILDHRAKAGESQYRADHPASVARVNVLKKNAVGGARNTPEEQNI